LPAETAAGQTARELLDAGHRHLRAAAVPEARRTAIAVLGALLDRQPGELLLEGARAVHPSIPEEYAGRLERLAAGEPLAYVLGTVGFRTVEVAVDRRVLIPRPETEGLVQLVLDWAGSRSAGGGTVADVGTGSGCIALALAMEGRFDRIIAADISEGALAVARRNLDKVGPVAPVELRFGDLLEPLAGEQLDVLVSNPPYVSDVEWAALDRGVRLHEPEVALVSAGGMRHIERLIVGASPLLRPGGLVAIEIDARRSGLALDLARHWGWRGAAVHRDLFGRERFLLMTKGES
jgi:release factor glutamine methyltransferase